MVHNALKMILSAGFISSYAALTTEQAAAIVSDIRDLIPNNQGGQGDFYGVMVRLAFHDCAGMGGCNGCFDTSIEDHGGLGPGADLLEPIYDAYAPIGASRADIWAMAGIVSVFEAGGPEIPFFSGRSDCVDEQLEDDSGLLPLADPEGDTWGHVLDVFVDRLGLSETDAVALMGAHTLGRAETANSGFEGGWVRNEAIFDNAFYQDVLGVRWTKMTQAGGSVWPTGGGNRIMLETDIAIFVDPDSCNSVGGGNNNLRGCTPNPTAFPIGASYADDQALWFSDFSAAFVRMQMIGVDGTLVETELDLSGDATASPTQSPETSAPTQTPRTEAPTQTPVSPTANPTTSSPTTSSPTTASPTANPTTKSPTTSSPTTASPRTQTPTQSPRTPAPTQTPETQAPTQQTSRTDAPTQISPTTGGPIRRQRTSRPTKAPKTRKPSRSPRPRN